MISDDEAMSQSSQPGLNDLISLSEAAQISGLSPSHLRLLVSGGKIWGMKLGRNWFTTVQAINEYMKTERKRGPKPQTAP